VTDADGQVLADGPLLECADLARPADAHGLGITAVVTIDPAGSAPAPVQGVADQGIDVLDSGDRIYVTAFDESVPHARDRGATTIYDLDPTGRYLAFGAVPGHVPGAEALSARNGVLRVALGMSRLSGVPRGEVIDRRGVATLREHGGSLQLLGSSIGAGHKDWIESLAWVGDNAVLEAPDGTRYVYDVADPAKPHLAAAVTLPGHIDFVASTTQQRTRVVGPDERHSGLDTPSAVGVLDLTDPTRPRMIHSTSLGKGRAEGGLQSFASLPDLHLLTVPLRTVKTVGPPQCPLLHGRPSCSTDIYSAALVRIGANDSTRVVGRISVGGYPRRFFAVRGLLVAVTDETVVLIDPVRARVLDTVHGDNHKS
jgi:hypothetical protein